MIFTLIFILVVKTETLKEQKLEIKELQAKLKLSEVKYLMIVAKIKERAKGERE
ncbi:MAG: hypothetical protein BWY95_02461 [Bacteroidetes bacterium ADurb.BinA104]|nr:MAG: hypothetical protein BWY95_02461 [Bacteroidetes bacterium ADurb.BinA104]